ncbi:hypothetical protein BpHYR1_048468 [Brachionus plicatilis]|uniref:Uncharacterized protein n=1 Tax=Brachionus plicatilis TaxID=10195 RepID=A0A3M7SJF8_BRAPC|nr:hypothetical protein BpHYR1_048468 [Brachionus plicatilis]
MTFGQVPFLMKLSSKLIEQNSLYLARIPFSAFKNFLTISEGSNEGYMPFGRSRDLAQNFNFSFSLKVVLQNLSTDTNFIPPKLMLCRLAEFLQILNLGGTKFVSVDKFCRTTFKLKIPINKICA